ncbi:glycosyltransferase [Psychromonas sp. psych-6C06]|uniref:glycosyltransferase family 2 protein n=1 Tax=Psychromonas sp. psych-6C06 TaxID=2058089 RepID=UPI000C324624|nr:glycosyltransferase family 2 protein [Psychromonas sp. psych-6C06]PKF61961.1 glycosyltransferase [Psychromonas sp. psych-6C06]
MVVNPELSIVVCVLNEEESIDLFLDAVTPFIEQSVNSYEIVFVNDGSTDRTLEIIKERVADPERHVKLVNLSRNFGKDTALTAGLDYAKGQAVIPMDVDLQDPPDLIPEMVKKWREGADSVIAVRKDRSDDGIVKRKTATAFYKIIGRMSKVDMPQNAGDYRLVDRKVVDVLQKMPEKARFMKGLFAFPGFTKDYVYYSRPARVAGTTKWNYWKLWNFALDGIFSFSTAPLRIWTYAGVCVGFASLAYLTFVIIKTLVFGVDVPGYASLITLILFFSSLNLIGIGVLGEYIGRIFEEVKNRPLYVIEGYYGHEEQDQTVTQPASRVRQKIE